MVHDFNAAIKSTVFWMCFFNLNILYVSQKIHWIEIISAKIIFLLS